MFEKGAKALLIAATFFFVEAQTSRKTQTVDKWV
jgi:hypothetical protein